jgi:hypothetical protein
MRLSMNHLRVDEWILRLVTMNPSQVCGMEARLREKGTTHDFLRTSIQWFPL